jgi:hypothetical protein
MSKEGIILEHSEKAFSAEVSRASTLDDKADKFTAAVAVATPVCPKSLGTNVDNRL